MNQFQRRVLPLLIIPFLLFLIGTTGYMLIEKWSVTDAFFMTAITLSTVGFGEVHPLSDFGRLFTIGLIFLGVGSIAYGFSAIGEYLLTSQFTERLRSRRMDRLIKKLKEHVIVCGFGRVGVGAVATLLDNKKNVVVIDANEEKEESIEQIGAIPIIGDATDDHYLVQAGIDTATSILICTGDDARNLFIVLSARKLNPALFIIARATNQTNEAKMILAGADRVVSPYQIGGKHMANIVLRPHVTDFLDVVTLDGGVELWMEEIQISHTSPIIDKPVQEFGQTYAHGIRIIALMQHESGRTITPNAATILRANDRMIVLGPRDKLSDLAKIVAPPQKKAT